MWWGFECVCVGDKAHSMLLAFKKKMECRDWRFLSMSLFKTSSVKFDYSRQLHLLESQGLFKVSQTSVTPSARRHTSTHAKQDRWGNAEWFIHEEVLGELRLCPACLIMAGLWVRCSLDLSLCWQHTTFPTCCVYLWDSALHVTTHKKSCADWCDEIYIYMYIYWLTVYTDRQTER